jgi:sulfur carrier protein ThiS
MRPIFGILSRPHSGLRREENTSLRLPCLLRHLNFHTREYAVEAKKKILDDAILAKPSLSVRNICH